MRVADARSIAIDWVHEKGRALPGYRGAWFAGSVCWMNDTDTLAPSSDVDVTVIVRSADLPDAKPGKFRYRNMLLEVTVAPDSNLDDPDIALDAAVASAIARRHLIDDPEAILGPWFDRVGAAFGQHDTIIARIHAQAASIRHRTTSIDPAAPFHRQILWIFPATLATSLPVIAELGNPTVRKRFLAARQVLQRHGYDETYENLLAIFGFDTVSSAQAATWLDWLTDLYDLAQDTPTTSSWRQDVDQDSRAISVDGTRDLIEAGDHREAIWWIIATFARALDILANATQPVDATVHHQRLIDITDSIGIGSREEMLAVTQRLHDFLPHLENVAIAIVDASAHTRDAASHE